MTVSTPIESPPPGATQALAVGATLSSRWGRLRGYTGGSMSTPLSRATGAFVGLPDSGKTHLVQSCPGGYVLNLDLSTAPSRLNADLWPGVAPDGRALGDDGRPMILEWKNVQERVDLLIDLARQNEPRPTTVFFDTMGSAIRMAKPWSSSALFTNQNGQAMWDRVHEAIIGMTVNLRNAGYGVFWNLHIVNGKVPLGEDRYKFAPQLTITDTFWAKIYQLFGVVFSVQAPTEDVTSIVEVPVQVRGETKMEKKTVTTKERVYFVTTSDPEYAGITKARVTKPLPARIILPKVNPWEHLESVYADHTRG